MKPTEHLTDRVVTYLPMEYEPSTPPPLKLRRSQSVPDNGYEAIRDVEAYGGITRWKDGEVTTWEPVSRRATPIIDAQPSEGWEKWRARVNGYWNSHRYECQVCGLDKDARGYLQRPINVNDGPIRLYPDTGEWDTGNEPDSELLALCDPCANEASLIAAESRVSRLGLVVIRLQGRRKRMERRRRNLIAQQRADRQLRRDRRNEYKVELNQHIERFKSEGVPISREFVHRFANIDR